jgi:hypothetical protein
MQIEPYLRCGTTSAYAARMQRLRSPRLALIAGLTVFLLLGLRTRASGSDSDTDQFREDVLHCEDAVSHLIECCPHFDAASVRCDYAYEPPDGCSGPDQTATYINPDLAQPASDCIRAASCETLVANGTCVRAQMIEEQDGTSNDNNSGSGACL